MQNPSTDPVKKPKLPPVGIIRTVNKIRETFTRVNRKMVPPPIALFELITSQWVSQSISVAASLGVADQIGDAPVAISELAKKVGAHEESLYRLLRALAPIGIFVEHADRNFSLTEMGRCLRTDHPQSVRFMSMFQGQINWAHWGALEYCVKTGKNAVEHVQGMKGFEYLAKHPEKAEVFDRAMTNVSAMELETVLAVYDFSSFSTIADIGGGHGSFLGAVLKTHPQAKGILFDLPHVVEAAIPRVAAAGLASRIDIQSGSFFDSVPAGADAYLMKHIIHDWSDEESIRIMKNVRAKIPAHGKLLLIETLVPAPNVPHFSKLLDLEMLVVTTGKERTEADFAELFAKAGFRLSRIVPTISMANVIEAEPV